MGVATETGQSGRQRRVIVFADLVESVRLMEEHELSVIDRWRRFAMLVRTELVPRHSGRLIRTAGDGFLLDFDSTKAALAFSFQLHDSLENLNIDCQAGELMLLRIGIHDAEVLVDAFEAYGAGVNLAARLAGLAKPGGTVLSPQACANVVDGVDATIEDLGPRFVKHVREPIRAFAAYPPNRETSHPYRHLPPSLEDLRPSIAVIPFRAIPSDPIHDALGHAMVDDIIAALSRHPGLRVLSRASTAPLREALLTIDQLQQVHRVLGASFLVTGQYYMLGTKVRLSVELCALPSGEVQWGDTSIAEVSALFAGEDELVPHVVANVCQRVLAHELSRVRSLPMTSLPSYTIYLGGTGLMNSLAEPDFIRSREVFEHLVDRHPRQASPHAMLARWHVLRVVQGWSTNPQVENIAATEHAQRAIEINTHQAVALTTLALAKMNLERDVAGARRYNELALQADPLEPHAWAQLSAAQSLMGQHSQAEASAARALMISPLDPNRFIFEAYAALAAFVAGKYELAAQYAQQSVRRNMLHVPSHRLLGGSLWLAGRQDDAGMAVRRFLSVFPQSRAGRSGPGQGGLSSPSQWKEILNEALCSAGLPE